MATAHTSGIVAVEFDGDALRAALQVHGYIVHAGAPDCQQQREQAYWPHVSVCYGVQPRHIGAILDAIPPHCEALASLDAHFVKPVAHFDYERKAVTFVYAQLSGALDALYEFNTSMLDVVDSVQILANFVPHVSLARLPLGARLTALQQHQADSVIVSKRLRASRVVVRSPARANDYVFTVPSA